MKNVTKLFFLLVTILPISAFAQTLVVDYSFSGNLSDSSKNSNDLQITGSGTPFEFVEGVSGVKGDSAIAFYAGQALKGTVPIDNSSWSGTAVSVWVKNCSQGHVYTGPYYGGSINIVDGKVKVYFAQSLSMGFLLNTDKVNLNDGKWHHVVAQSNGSKTEIYIDGSLDTSRNETMYRLTSQNSDALVHLGTTRLDREKLLGTIDNFKIYDDALNAKEISDLYTYGKVTGSIVSPVFKHQKVTIYPNPSSGDVYFSVGELKAQVINLNGQIVLEQNHFSDKISVKSLARGVYILFLTNKDGVQVARTRFVKE